MKYIYLDLNKWVLLSRGWYKGAGKRYDLVCKLKKKVEDKEIKILVSLINLKETLKNMNQERRNKLLEFIFNLSQGNTIAPFRDWIVDKEVENIFLEKLNKRIDIRSLVICKGLSGIIGMEASIQGDFSEEVKAKMKEKVNSLETFKLIVSSQKSAERAREDDLYFKQQVNKFEEIRKRERKNKDKKEQFEGVLKSYFRDFIMQRIISFFFKYGFSVTRTDMNFKKIEDWLKRLPATYSYFSLLDWRDRDLNKKIEANDLYDLMSFTMGVAYCDILFGEKRFVALTKQAKLDKLYGRIVTSSLDEFKKAIS
ncbi:MAG: hypothetical protein ABIJ14_02460 [Nanoarchaeota archaeon]